MEFRHLRYLIAVAEELHFGRAAIRLNISQPPLSQQIRQLEEELGVTLFHRTKREVRLTEAGRRVVAEAELVLRQVNHFAKMAARAGQGEIGHLSVGVPGGVNPILIDTLRIFAQEFPGVRVELQYLSTGAQQEALLENKIRIGFLNQPIPEARLVMESVQKDPLWIALPTGHPLARLPQVSFRSLAKEQFVLFPRRATPGLHDAIIGLCRNCGFTLNVAHEVDNITGGLTLVSAGLGLAFCTPGVQKQWPGVDFRPLRNPTFQLEQFVAHRTDASSPALETFLSVVRRVAHKHRSQREG